MKKEEIKVIFSDIDGTLLDKDRMISDRTAEIVKKIKKDIPFILISSRMPKQMFHIEEKLENKGQIVVAYNGGLIKKGDQRISSKEIGIDVVEKIVDFNREKFAEGIHISLYNDNLWYAPRNDQWSQREENNTKVKTQIKDNKEVVEQWKKEKKGAHKLMIMGEKEKIDIMYQFIESKLGGVVVPYRSKDTYIEVADAKISKLTAVEEVLKLMGLELKNAMAFGDSYNDVEMLKNVGWGVCMKNGKEQAKNAANDIAGDSKEDAVAEYLQRIFGEK